MKQGSFGLFGAGGFGRLLAAQHRDRVAFLVDDAADVSDLLGIPVTARDAIPDDARLIVAIADPAVRRKIVAELEHEFATLIADTARIAEDVEFGPGTVMCELSMAAGFCRIGAHVHCNAYSYIGHDCTIGDFVTIGPRVGINGNVTVGNGVFCGAGAIVAQGVTIGDGAYIGMGALVSKDVPAGARVLGSRIFTTPAVVR